MRHPYDPVAAVEFARRQIDVANEILTGHLGTGHGLCMCGKTLPCTVAFSCSEIQRIYQGELAELSSPPADTIALPVLAEPQLVPAPKHQHRMPYWRTFCRGWPRSPRHAARDGSTSADF
ncbi:hypothetical protein [Actinospica robiniae]|uniref:hypothetical protein n=1 Tax=Actinospica robiniae TaxID=304901 RepID=UPI000556CBB2|nr:hypothetical protein [Actinospica robiniae]